jgi:mannose PTS system EIIA component
MIGIVVAAHGHLAREMLATAELILGELPNATACDVSPGLSTQELEQQLARAVASVEAGDGVLVLSDLIGGTPCTRSMALCQKARRLEVLTGLNVPMIIKAHALRSAGRTLREVAGQVVEAARNSVRWATEGLPPNLQAPTGS